MVATKEFTVVIVSKDGCMYTYAFSSVAILTGLPCTTIVQWNLSNAVTWGPNIFGLIREVAAIQMTSLKQSCEVLV